MKGRVAVLPGERIDRYRVLWSLSPEIEGHPGGRTFQALDEDTGARVVLQVASVDISELASYEVTLGRVRGVVFPCMAGIFGGGVDGDRAYLATAWVPGVSLSDMAHAASVDPQTGTALLWTMAAALAQLHACSLVHGDLHPRNVRVSPQGQPYLVGFMPGPFARPQTTLPSEVPLPRYAPPEFYVLDEVLPPGDVYALGLLGYQLLTTRELLPPGRAREMPALQERMLTALEQADSLGWRVPQALEQLLQRMLEVRPSHRLRDGSALSEALLRTCPGISDAGWLPRSLRGHFVRARHRAARRLLDEARLEIDRGGLLPAAACLRAVAELEFEGYDDEVLEGRELLVAVAWEGLVRGPGPAFWLLLHEAARGFDDEALAHNTLRLLRDTAPSAPAYTKVLQRLGEAPPVAERVALGCARLREAPRDPRALLELALCMTAQARGDSASVSSLQGAVLAGHGFYAQALAVRAGELPRAAHPLALLDELEVLLEAARREALGASATSQAAWSAPAELSLMLREDTSAPPRPPELDLPADPFEDPERVFEEGRMRLGAGQLDEAAQMFARLLEMEPSMRDPYHARVSAALRDLMWRALAMEAEPGSGLSLMRGIWELARGLGLEDLGHLGECLLVSSLPQDGGDAALAELLAREPRSIPFLQAAATQAQERGDQTAWAGHLLLAARELVRRRDLLSASKMLMAAKTASHGSEAEAAGREVFDLAAATATAAAAFRALAAGLPGDDAGAGLAACEAFLAEFPGYAPARERVAELAERAGLKLRASAALLELAFQALLREEELEARTLLRRVVSLDFENDHALLYLAALERPASDNGPDGMRLAVLERWGLTAAAIYRARSLLRGGRGDRWLHETLVRLEEQSGGDPSPHLFTLATMTLEAGDHRAAAGYVSRCLEAGGEPGLVMTLVAGSAELQTLLPRDELMDLMLDVGRS